MESLGETIKKWRETNRCSMRELGKMIGTSNETISRLEHDEYIVNLDMLEKMSKVFKIDYDELVKRICVETEHNGKKYYYTVSTDAK